MYYSILSIESFFILDKWLNYLLEIHLVFLCMHTKANNKVKPVLDKRHNIFPTIN